MQAPALAKMCMERTVEQPDGFDSRVFEAVLPLYSHVSS